MGFKKESGESFFNTQLKSLNDFGIDPSKIFVE